MYDFYLKNEPLKKLNDNYFHGESKIWNEYLEHATNDAYWQARNIRTHLVNIKPATLEVGGWFDAEDMFGALHTYDAIEKQNTQNDNRIIMGPWTYGGWKAKTGKNLPAIVLAATPAQHFSKWSLISLIIILKERQFKLGRSNHIYYRQQSMENIFAMAAKRSCNRKLVAQQRASTAFKQCKTEGEDEYISDPANPVPYL